MIIHENAQAMAALLGPNEVLVAHDVVADDERTLLVAWLKDQRSAGKLVRNPQDAGAYSTSFRAANGELTQFTRPNLAREDGSGQKLVWIPEVDEVVDPLPQEFWCIRARVIKRLGLGVLEEDPYKGSFMSFIEPGTGVHQHRDERVLVNAQERIILRCNVFLRRADGGGLPVFDGRVQLDVPDRGMWAFFPTELVHSATPVQGTGFRALLSFGFLARMEQLWGRRFRLDQSFVSEMGLDTRDDVREGLIKQLGASARTAGISELRISLLSFALRARGDFSVQEAAERLVVAPRDLWRVLHELQRNQILRSNSSEQCERGKVWVI